MINNQLIVNEKTTELSKFIVGRLLPVRQKRQVGPFTFIDHMGPSEIGHDGNYLDVDYHPHIGLSTLTYLYEGAIEHKDSIGTHQIVKAGDVAFMTAGKGVAHTERTPKNMRNGVHVMHGYQIWVALPKEKEQMEPRFDFIPKNQVPEWSEQGMNMKLIAGEGFGKKSPLPVHSALFMLEIKTQHKNSLVINGQLKGEIAVVIVEGELLNQEEKLTKGQMLISKTEDTCHLDLGDNTTLLLFGGKVLPEPRYIDWNFVSSSKELIKQAKEDWKNKRFPKIKDDNTYVPLPKRQI